MTSNYFRRYIAGYTVANFLRYPIIRRVTIANALELFMDDNTYFVTSTLPRVFF